jgi:hypothetical protein
MLLACEYCYGAEILITAAASTPLVIGWGLHQIRKLKNRNQSTCESNTKPDATMMCKTGPVGVEKHSGGIGAIGDNA